MTPDASVANAPPPPIPCEEIAAHAAFRSLLTIPGIAVDLRYATPDNFGGRNVYGGLDCASLRRAWMIPCTMSLRDCSERNWARLNGVGNRRGKRKSHGCRSMCRAYSFNVAM